MVVVMTNRVILKLGYWSGIVIFTITPMDDFEVVMGQELDLRKVKGAPMTHLDCLFIFSGRDPCVIPIARKKHEVFGRMIALSMVSTTSQGAKQPCSRKVGGVALDGKSICNT
jgi:hypothetical protein